MFGYYFSLALRSFKRNKALTFLMVLAIALGIGASMTTLTVFYVLSGDPSRRRATSCSIRASTRARRMASPPATSRKTSSPATTPSACCATRRAIGRPS